MRTWQSLLPSFPAATIPLLRSAPLRSPRGKKRNYFPLLDQNLLGKIRVITWQQAPESPSMHYGLQNLYQIPAKESTTVKPDFAASPWLVLCYHRAYNCSAWHKFNTDFIPFYRTFFRRVHIFYTRAHSLLLLPILPAVMPRCLTEVSWRFNDGNSP